MHSRKMLLWGSFGLVLIASICISFSVGHPQLFIDENQQDDLPLESQDVAEDEPLTRTRRDSLPAGGHHHQQHHGWAWPKHHGWEQKGWGGWPSVGPVFTYVRTDGWSNFQWGVRHKVGKGGWGK